MIYKNIYFSFFIWLLWLFIDNKDQKETLVETCCVSGTVNALWHVLFQCPRSFYSFFTCLSKAHIALKRADRLLPQIHDQRERQQMNADDLCCCDCSEAEAADRRRSGALQVCACVFTDPRPALRSLNVQQRRCSEPSDDTLKWRCDCPSVEHRRKWMKSRWLT